MKSVDNGSVALTIEWDGATIRAIDHVPTCSKPDYIAIGRITRLSDTVVKVSGLMGQVSRAHLWLLAQVLLGEGFLYLYAERTEHHVMPLADLITGGDFHGHWRIDLSTLRERRRSRQGRATELAC